MDKTPESIWQGEFRLSPDLTMKCHVLSDGTRMIEEQSVIAFLKWLENGESIDADMDEFKKFVKWQAGKGGSKSTQNQRDELFCPSRRNDTWR